MTDALVIGIAAPVAAIIGAGLSYVATRQRDAPTVEISREQAALVAWAEFATSSRAELTRVRNELHRTEDRADALRRRLDECLDRQRRNGDA